MSVIQTLVDLHEVIIDGGILHRGDAGGAHGLQCLVELRSFVIEACGRLCAERDLGGVIAQRARRPARGVALDMTPGRILGGGRNVRQLQCGRVDPDGMSVRAAEQHGPVGQHGVEVRQAQGQTGRIDHGHFEPRSALAGPIFQTGCDPALDRRRSHLFVVEAALTQILCALRRMRMRIDDARQHDSSRRDRSCGCSDR